MTTATTALAAGAAIVAAAAFPACRAVPHALRWIYWRGRR